jgi:hypothetical protein
MVFTKSIYLAPQPTESDSESDESDSESDESDSESDESDINDCGSNATESLGACVITHLVGDPYV